MTAAFDSSTIVASTGLVTGSGVGRGVLAAARLSAAVVEACVDHDARGRALLMDRAETVASLTALLRV